MNFRKFVAPALIIAGLSKCAASPQTSRSLAALTLHIDRRGVADLQEARVTLDTRCDQSIAYSSNHDARNILFNRTSGLLTAARMFNLANPDIRQAFSETMLVAEYRRRNRDTLGFVRECEAVRVRELSFAGRNEIVSGNLLSIAPHIEDGELYDRQEMYTTTIHELLHVVWLRVMPEELRVHFVQIVASLLNRGFHMRTASMIQNDYMHLRGRVAVQRYLERVHN